MKKRQDRTAAVAKIGGVEKSDRNTVKRICFLLTLCFISISANCYAAGGEQSIETEMGLMQIVRMPDRPADTVMMDGKVIFQSPWNYVRFYKYFHTGKSITVLFGANCGGSGCPKDDLYFVTIAKDQEPVTTTHKRFRGRPSTDDISIVDGIITVYLGYENKQMKYARLEKNKVTISYKEPDTFSLEDKNCAYLFEVLHQCIKLNETGKKCPDLANGYTSFGRGTMSSLMYFSKDHPGFNEEIFKQYCNESCGTQTLPEYANFKDNVCKTK